MKAAAVAYLLLISALQALDSGQAQRRVAMSEAMPIVSAEKLRSDEVPLPKDVKLLPHYVMAGDTLDVIAEMYGTRREWILYVNPWIFHDLQLRDQMKLRIPVIMSDAGRRQLEALVPAEKGEQDEVGEDAAATASERAGDAGK